MKKRFISVVICGVFSITLCSLSVENYVEYFLHSHSIQAYNQEIQQKEQEVKSLSEQLYEKGDTLCSLKEISNFLYQYDDVEISSVRSFQLEGDSIQILNVVSAIDSDEVCDGYEITLHTKNLKKLMEYLDTAKMVYHSADFLTETNQAILRVRTGGNFSGDIRTET